MAERFNYRQDFKVGFENKCIRLFVEAYRQSIINRTIRLDWEENDITSQLHEYIENNPIRTKTPSIATDIEHHLPNKSIKKKKGFATRDLRIDLRFVTFCSEKEYRVFFEAKNLKEKSSALKRRYIETGINNYTSNRYPHGFLVGYLLEGSVCSTVNGINKLLKKDYRQCESLIPLAHPFVKHYYESTHQNCSIKHLIFDFTVCCLTTL
ncbi:MAG: hypothetical protein FWC10_09275 [Lentimicrobiaceae bacterium]|nr:hypothetical protein [Lentimicrobiaceae bacterium]